MALVRPRNEDVPGVAHFAPASWAGSNCAGGRNEGCANELPSTWKENIMSVEGKIKEGAGYIKEEMNEHGKDPESQRKAQEGRDLRNEGRMEDGKPPKTTKPGTGH
jgi:hypothetical protein